MNKIGIWNTAFLGDAVLTLPLIHTVKAAYPDADIHFFVRKGFGTLFENQPELAAVHEYDKRGKHKSMLSTMQYGRDLARMGFTLWISAHSSIRSGIVAWGTSARRRIGYSKPLVNNWLYTHTVNRKFTELEEIERLLELVRPLGIDQFHSWPELVLPETAYAAAQTFWEEHLSGDAPVIGVHPGSVWGTKRWPAESYAAIVRRGVESGARVLVFAGPGEEEVARDVLHLSGVEESPLVFDLACKVSLVELAAYLGRLDCYVSNDSGPMHLAWAQRTPVTAIFGPTVKELGFYPRGAQSSVLEAEVSCRPCGLHGPQVCPEQHFKCMLDISVEKVWQDVQSKLNY